KRRRAQTRRPSLSPRMSEIDVHGSDCCFLTITLRKENAAHNITPRTPHKNQRVRYPHTSYTQVPPIGASTNAMENAAVKSPMYCPRLSTELRWATKPSSKGVVNISPSVHTNTVTPIGPSEEVSGSRANPAHNKNAPRPITCRVSKRSTACMIGI